MGGINYEVEYYLRCLNQAIGPLNRDPIRFRFDTYLSSSVDLAWDTVTEGCKIGRALDHLVINAMQAISALNIRQGYSLMEVFRPEKPGVITFVTKDIGDKVILDISDNGSGVNPEIVIAATTNGQIRDDISKNVFAALDHIFGEGITTKPNGFYGGSGLHLAREYVTSLGGKIYVLGTTYLKEGYKVTLGKHHGEATGTTFRIEIPFSSERGSL